MCSCEEDFAAMVTESLQSHQTPNSGEGSNTFQNYATHQQHLVSVIIQVSGTNDSFDTDSVQTSGQPKFLQSRELYL